MLEKLIIKNYLLLKNIEIDFSPRFNIITGETGAGKSILINALSLLMGERADYSIISSNREKMFIEGIVKISEDSKDVINKILNDNEIDSIGDNLIIRRELYSKGYSRNFVNDSPVPTSVLASLGDVMVDIHSQNEHQSLLKKEVHIELLDSYLCKTEGKKFIEKLDNYKQEYVNLLNKTSEYENIKQKKEELDSKRNFLEFQLKEIKEVNPAPGEDDELENELKTGENIESIRQGLTAAYLNLYEDSGSISERLKITEKELAKTAEYNSEFRKILNEIETTSTAINEASRQVQRLIENLSFDPGQIEQIRERLYKLQFIKKKYGGSLDEAIKLKEKLESDLALVDNFDEKIAKLENEIKQAKESLFKKAGEISKIRKEKSKTLAQDIVKILNEVGFENAEFKVALTLVESLGPSGTDDVEFMVKINKGDAFSSLRKTPSGGEVSRIMLAVKTVLADADKVNMLVFDEIDIGISGRIAQKVGRVMKKLSEYRQVIAITHLAQIAALADEHLLVEKETEGDSTITKIRPLDKNEKVIEVAKLLSGEKVTDASIKSAKELIGP
ncbi:MAG: DNA repair protein RecN [Chlorobi bacterium]|nr:DNA repair protein RecN [Chlorobiota bacterium]MCI0716583.1 DNA repair protein RecN [Chlorobiota bacterium]